MQWLGEITNAITTRQDDVWHSKGKNPPIPELKN
jgi:hypothetical protein